MGIDIVIIGCLLVSLCYRPVAVANLSPQLRSSARSRPQRTSIC